MVHYDCFSSFEERASRLRKHKLKALKKERQKKLKRQQKKKKGWYVKRSKKLDRLVDEKDLIIRTSDNRPTRRDLEILDNDIDKTLIYFMKDPHVEEKSRRIWVGEHLEDTLHLKHFEHSQFIIKAVPDDILIEEAVMIWKKQWVGKRRRIEMGTTTIGGYDMFNDLEAQWVLHREW